MKKAKGKYFIFMGLLLIAAALSLTAYNLYDEYRAQQSAQQVMNRLEEYFPAAAPTGEPTLPAAPVPSQEPEIPDYVLNPDMEMPAQAIDGQDYIGVLRIPSLDLELPIISQWSYPGLKIAPCRYSGSAYSGNLVIAGHNYPSHFGNLKNLREGDVATFTDMDGNEFTYVMAARETLQSRAIEEMESGGWDLTLFTCTVGGQARVTIRFELVETA